MRAVLAVKVPSGATLNYVFSSDSVLVFVP